MISLSSSECFLNSLEWPDRGFDSLQLPTPAVQIKRMESRPTLARHRRHPPWKARPLP